MSSGRTSYLQFKFRSFDLELSEIRNEIAATRLCHGLLVGKKVARLDAMRVNKGCHREVKAATKVLATRFRCSSGVRRYNQSFKLTVDSVLLALPLQSLLSTAG